MLVMTAKLTKRKIIAWVLIIGVVICAAIVLLGNEGEGDAIITGENQGSNKRIELKSVKSNEDRVALLNSFGWETGKDPLEFMEVRIPAEFDEVYEKYNKIQNEQGLDLKKYSGKRVMRYTYQVTNHPNGEKGVIANILIYKNKLIAGDICSPQLNGFMHGLIKTSDATVTEESNSGNQAEQIENSESDEKEIETETEGKTDSENKESDESKNDNDDD